MYAVEGPFKGQRIQRGGKDVPRNNVPPDCSACPKQSPELAHRHELSLRNIRTLNIYWQSQCVPINADGILRDNLATVARLIRDHELGTTARVLASAFSRSV